MNLEMRGQWSEAADAYSGVAAGASDEALRARALLRRAACLLETGTQSDVDSAEDAVDDAGPLVDRIGSPTLQAQLLLQRGRLHDSRGRLARAHELFLQARGAVGEEDLVGLAEIDLELASAERRQGELAKAYEVIGSIPEELPDRIRARLLDEKGAVLLERGEFAKARSALEGALELDEQTASSYASVSSRLLLAEACMRTGDHDRALDLTNASIRACERAKGDRGLSEAYAMLGLLYEDREQYLLATKCYQDSYDIDQRSGDDLGRVRAKRCLARVARKAGDTEGARELLKDARERLPADERLERVLLMREEGELALSGDAPNYDLAIQRFSDALRSAEASGDERIVALAKRHLARAHRENDDLQRAQDLLLEARAALEEREDLRALDDLLDDLGEVYLEQDEYDAALEALSQSLELDIELDRVGSKGRSLMLLGRVHQEKGDADTARTHFEGALEVYTRAAHGVGKSDALHHLGAWHLDHGKVERAIEYLRQGLLLDSRLNDTMGTVRAKRMLAAAHRVQGNFERATEYLSEARRDLAHIDDEAEAAYLALEEGRLEYARHRYGDARRLLEQTMQLFNALDHRSGDIATVQRALALAMAQEGDYDAALEQLDHAEVTFKAKGDFPELDELHDDRAEVHLLRGQFAEAEQSVLKSLDHGQRHQSMRGEGRSHLLRAKIAMATGRRDEAKKYIQLAQSVYEDTHDEVGLAQALIALGDWYAERGGDGDARRAIAQYKLARRLEHDHLDRRGVAECNRKLAEVHLQRNDFLPAEDALEEAAAALEQIDDPSGQAKVDLLFGKVWLARADHRQATEHLERAVKTFSTITRNGDLVESQQLLVTSLLAQGQSEQALETMRDIGDDSSAMYGVLVEDLHDAIAKTAAPAIRAGNYGDAIKGVFGAIEVMIRERSAKLDDSVRPREDAIWRHRKAWLEHGEDVPEIPGKMGIESFSGFIQGCFSLLRNPAVHNNVEFTPADAFAAVAAGHLIVRVIEQGGLPWCCEAEANAP